jgi:predicted metal-dependent hydrolase
MDHRYTLTLAAIEARLYTDEADSIFVRWPTAEKELPSGNHTPGGLSETCLHFMEDIMTKTGRPNHKWDNYLYLHFGGWDLLMDYVKRDPKRRGYLLRCEEKGYSVSEDRQYFDEALVSNGIVNGTAAAIPSEAMRCIIEANIYLVRHFCGLYSSATKDTLCAEIRQFLEKHRRWLEKHLAKSRELEESKAALRRLTPEDIRALKKQARKMIPERAAYYAPLIGVTYGRISIRCQKTRWGSCSAKGDLSFNCLLMLTPPGVVDSIVVHELCHRKVMNHSARFYAEVLKVLPEYRQHQKWLREHGEMILAMADKA